MPNKHGQIINNDFVAPEGQFRIMRESMVDGELEIIADYYQQYRAEVAIKALVEECGGNVFTLCDDQGNTLDHM